MTKIINVIKFENGAVKFGIEVESTHADSFTFKQAKQQLKDCRVMDILSLDFISEDLVLLYDDEFLFTVNKSEDLGLVVIALSDDNGKFYASHEICGHCIICNYSEDEDGEGIYGELTSSQVEAIHHAFITQQIARGVIPQENVEKYIERKLTPTLMFKELPNWMA